MFNLLKSEFTKILTLRSTYIVAGVLGLLAIIIGFAVAGLAAPNGEAGIVNVAIFKTAVDTLFTVIAGVIGIIVSMIILREYRHNTITYTLTASNSRISVFFSKVLAGLGYGWAIALATSLLAILAASIGLVLNDVSLSTQELDIGGLLLTQGLHVTFFILVGLTLGFIFKNPIAVIVTIFVAPIIENMSFLVLKENAQYLPFSTFGSLTQSDVPIGITVAAFAYLLGLLALALVLFMKRDA